MRILWITNTVFPAPSRALGLEPPVFGGWMYGLAAQLAGLKGITLAIATVYAGAEPRALAIDGVTYFLLPQSPTARTSGWQGVRDQFQPDVIHVHGTEYPHAMACMRQFQNIPYVVSIQGLVGVCARYYLGGISNRDVLRNLTVRDLLRMDTLFHARANFARRGVLEREYLLRANHVIGRTSWDYAHTRSINPKARYHFCNETLRADFYSARKWKRREDRRYSIFLSQGSYPIKGMHQVMKAAAILAPELGTVNIRVAGESPVGAPTIKGRLRRSGYGAYIERLRREIGTGVNLSFTGPLDESKMIDEYLRSDVFVCPSAIENSSNSIGEAQLLGVPTIASFVGGSPEMVHHGVTGLLYRFEEYEMLAEQLRSVFVDSSLCAALSENGIAAAAARHNLETNASRMTEIYQEVVR
jgi:L-malate glycosyltransferase